MLLLRLKWLHQAQFAGWYLAEDEGLYREEGLEVEISPGGPDVDPEKLVGCGEAHFAQAGGIESVLAARAAGLPVVAIGAVFQRIDVAFIAKRDAGIAALADFAGRTVSTWHTGVHLILRALLRRAGVDPASINEIAQAESMQPFLQGDVSVAAATFFNQLPQLRSQGVTDLVVFDPADQGVVFPRDVIITSEKMIADHPDVVRRFLRAGLRGWKQAIADQTTAVAAVMRRAPTLDRRHQAVMISEVSKLMTHGAGTARGIGWIEPTAVRAAHDFLVENGQLAGAIDVGRSHTTRFWQAV